MPTSRRRVVTQRKNSPPMAHWMRTVETWSFIDGPCPGDAAILAFLFRCIPVNERRLWSSRRPNRSGVPFPLYSGNRTPVGLGRRLGDPYSTDDRQIAGRLVEAFGAGLGGHHDVFDAGAAPAGQVDA